MILKRVIPQKSVGFLFSGFPIVVPWSRAIARQQFGFASLSLFLLPLDSLPYPKPVKKVLEVFTMLSPDIIMQFEVRFFFIRSSAWFSYRDAVINYFSSVGSETLYMWTWGDIPDNF